MGNNIVAEDVAGLAKIFGVDFTQKDVNTLQNWMNEEEIDQNQNWSD